MPLLSGRTPARSAAFWGFLLHTGAALWLWRTWGAAARGGGLFWMDFPLSLIWAGVPGRGFLLASLFGGGLWWAALAAGLALAVGRIARRG